MRALIIIALSIYISFSIDMDDPRCYCYPDLIEELCDRDYVIIAKVFGSLTPSDNTRRSDLHRHSKIYYNLTRVVYLGKVMRPENITFMTASTPAHFNECTVELNLSRSYMISGDANGRELVMSRCGLHHPWRLGRNFTYEYLREVIATTCVKYRGVYKNRTEVVL